MANSQIGIQGETLPLFFNYKLDGVDLADVTGRIANLECQLLEEGASGSLKLTLTGEDARISLDAEAHMYKALLTQEETFALPQTVKWQFKVLDSEDNAIADDIGVFTLGRALSKTALEANE